MSCICINRDYKGTQAPLSWLLTTMDGSDSEYWASFEEPDGSLIHTDDADSDGQPSTESGDSLLHMLQNDPEFEEERRDPYTRNLIFGEPLPINPDDTEDPVHWRRKALAQAEEFREDALMAESEEEFQLSQILEFHALMDAEGLREEAWEELGFTSADRAAARIDEGELGRRRAAYSDLRRVSGHIRAAKVKLEAKAKAEAEAVRAVESAVEEAAVVEQGDRGAKGGVRDTGAIRTHDVKKAQRRETNRKHYEK